VQRGAASCRGLHKVADICKCVVSCIEQQCVTVCCSVLQSVAVCCNEPPVMPVHVPSSSTPMAYIASPALHCVAVCCSECSELQ